MATADDFDSCRNLLRSGSRSFHLASFLLPAMLRDSACGLYAFCREADDAIDEGADPVAGLELVQRRLRDVYRLDAAPEAAVDRVFRGVVCRHDLPRALPEALLEGFAWDASARRYDDLDSLLDYAIRVAGSVGIMMAVLMGRREPEVLARAAELGVAMQLTNIARDVGADARAGRLYLPQAWLREAGIDPSGFVAEPVFSEALAGVVRRLLGVADTYYRRADRGIPYLPARARPAMYAARLLYAAIGDELARRNFDSVNSRSVVPLKAKLGQLARVPVLMTVPAKRLSEPVMPQARVLVEAVSLRSVRPGNGEAANGLLARAERNVSWVLDLFASLEQRERRQVAPRPTRRTWGGASRAPSMAASTPGEAS